VNIATTHVLRII